MEDLTPNLSFDMNSLRDKLRKITEELGRKDLDRDMFRDRFISEGFKIKKIKPVTCEHTTFLSVDAAIVKKELRHHAIWGTHSIVLYSEFDGELHPDPLAQGTIRYTNLKYDSHIDVGLFSPYRHIDSRANSIRIAEEYSSLLTSWHGMDAEDIDLFLIDGSIHTTLKRLKDETRISSFPEHREALQLHKELMDSGKVIGLVEDSHSSDLAKKVGLELTNIALLELILEENEYVTQRKDGINICHLKLPSKNLDYTHPRTSSPLVVRWEFSYGNFEADLANLFSLWMLEGDIWHPQIYPMRITDYLTRRLKIGGILDALIAENELDPKHRDMREA